MLTRNHGHIVSIASMAGIVGVGTLTDYCASKFAAVGFSDSLNAELYMSGKNGVHVTTVCPTYIDTGMFDGAKTESVYYVYAQDSVQFCERSNLALSTTSEYQT